MNTCLKIIVFVYATLLNCSLYATPTAKFSIIALAKAPEQLLGNSIIGAQYSVTNNTKITRTLTLSPIAGVSQNTAGPEACTNPFTLAPGQSCMLNLTLTAAEMGTGIHDGPTICKTNGNSNTPDPFLCSKPSNEDRLNVSIISCNSGACLNAEKTAALRAITSSYKQQYQIPGVLAGIWIPGQGQLIITDGVADLSSNRPISPTDHFRIASITKSFTTTVMLQLVQEGRLNLNDSLTSFGINLTYNNTATVAQAADMRSGIFNYSADPNFLNQLIDNLFREWQPQELLDFANINLPYFTPGQQPASTYWHYSNTNTVILGMIIETLTGNFIGDEITERIIKPLGLNGTSYSTSPMMPTPFISNYVADNPPEDITLVNPSFTAAAGAMVSTLDDLHKWSEALATGTLLTPTMQALRISSILPINFNPCYDQHNRQPTTCPEYNAYGYGLGNLSGWLGHTGDYFGLLLLMMYEPKSGASIVIVTNISGVNEHIPTRMFLDYLTVLNS